MGRPVPPRVDLHRVRPAAARQLPRAHREQLRRRARRSPRWRGLGAPVQTAAQARAPGGRAKLELKVKRLDTLYDTERAFVHLYGDSADAFWLDSSKVDERARFSFMGAAGGPLGATIAYDVDCGEVRVERGGETEMLRESIFDYLSREMRRLRYLSDDLPFDFNCGFVGYFGYELKADCEGNAAPPVARCPTRPSSSPTA